MTGVSVEDVRKVLERGKSEDFTLLDVRQPFEYREVHLPGAKLVPLAELVDRLDEIPRDRPVIVYCRSGNRSGAAAGLLEGQGFPDVRNMLGGISAWQGAAAVGEVHEGLAYCVLAMRAEDVLLLACGMEMVLQDFYDRLAREAESQDLRMLFRQLAGFEVKHRERLYRLHLKTGANPMERVVFEVQARERARDSRGRPLAEGGVEPEAFSEDSGLRPDQVTDALELAMQFEAQALDYYLRCAEGRAPEVAEIFRKLAGEEKGHLRMLAALLDRRGEAAAAG